MHDLPFRAVVVRLGHRLSHADVRRASAARARGVRARAASGRPPRRPLASTRTTSARSPRPTASATPASPRARSGACSRAPGSASPSAEVACREAKKPHFQVVLAVADKAQVGRTPRTPRQVELMTPSRASSARSSSSSSRIAIIDGAMGTTIRTYGMKEADIRGERFKDSKKDLLNNGDLFSLTQPQMIWRHPPALPRSGRRHHRDEHLRRDQHRPERVLRRRSARARRAQGPGVLPEDHRRPVPQRPRLGDQRAVGAAVPRVGRSRRPTPTASRASSPAPSGR